MLKLHKLMMTTLKSYEIIQICSRMESLHTCILLRAGVYKKCREEILVLWMSVLSSIPWVRGSSKAFMFLCCICSIYPTHLGL